MSEMEITALVCNAVISFVIPLVIWVILICKYRDERRGIVILFILGALFYAGLQWGLKQHGLQYLFNHTDLMRFMTNYYIAYLFVVAFIGAVLAVIPEWVVIQLVFRRKVTFKQAITMGLGYAAAESVLLVGYQSVMTIIEYYGKDSDTELVMAAGELFLSCYERILLTIIEIGLIVVLAYFIEQKMSVRGVLVKLLCQAVIAFLPGFFIAFSTKDFLEVFDRSVTLVMVYVVLTAAAVCSVAVLDGLKWKMYES